MIQDQLTDYISSQMKLGVSRDAIKSALVSAGWVSGDVEDTLKKVEGGSTAAVSVGSTVAAQSIAAAAKPASDVKVTSSGSPQMIRMSDLVSSSPASSAASVTKTSASQFGGKISGNSFEATPMGGSSSGMGKKSSSMMTWIIAGVLVIIFAGLAWYFYSANASLSAQVSSLTNQSNSVNTQLSTLKSQLDASSTAFSLQVGLLTSENTDLALDLSFYAVAPGASMSSTPITVNGALSVGTGKALYAVTTSLGAKIFITSTNNASTTDMLKAAVGNPVQVSGTYIPGSDEMTASAVSTSSVQ